MSRSYRKTPIRGTCGSSHSSEKQDKKIWHRIYRRMEKRAIRRYSDVMPVKHDAVNQYSMSKDGKSWMPHWWVFGFGNRKKDMRK